MSHSKRNTSLAFFTAHEREQLKGTWGSRSTRLARDSFLPFGHCQLCLLRAREPVACPSAGHLFCRECAVSNLLAQNAERKRLRKEVERRKVEDAEEKDLKSAEQASRDLEAFERTQSGFTGVKRKSEADDDELARVAREGGMYSGRRRRGSENFEKAPSDGSSFWIPDAVPDNQNHDLKETKRQPICPASTDNRPHDFTLKTLVPVHFSNDTANASDASTSSCPSCNRALSNSTKAVLAKPCGHVVCKPCSDKFQTPLEGAVSRSENEDTGTVLCYVCQEDVTPGRKAKKRKHDKNGETKDSKKEKGSERGLVVLSSDGTGFAGGGKSEVRRDGIAFQC